MWGGVKGGKQKQKLDKPIVTNLVNTLIDQFLEGRLMPNTSSRGFAQYLNATTKTI